MSSEIARVKQTLAEYCHRVDRGRWVFKDRLIETNFVATLADVAESFPSLNWPGA